MEFLLRQDIDTEKWDKRIEDDPKENIFCYSWYLDAASKNWGAFVSGDYETIFPVPYASKFSVKSLYQPPFSRELDIFGDSIQWEELIMRFPKLFKSIHFRNREAGIFPQYTERRHQYLDLTQEIKYSSNARRLIKKAGERFEIKRGKNPKELMQIFVETVLHKLDSISNEDLERLNNIMLNALKNGNGELYEAYQNGSMVGGTFFLMDKKRITYLKGASTEEAKKGGVMYNMIDMAINKYKEDFNTFDFGGSEIEGVANFYRKFGASDRIYYNYNIDNLPLWFKTLKRFKR